MRPSRSGFTLVEMLVVIGITTLFAAMAIGYSHVGENENALTVETAKVAELILQARELALATYGGSLTSGGTQNACAFGVQFDYTSQSYSLFAYEPAAPGARCPSIASTTAMGLGTAQDPSLYIKEYDAASWQIPPAQGVQLVMGGNVPSFVPCSNALGSGQTSGIVNDILFYPPDPTMLVNYYNDTDPSVLHTPKATSVVCLQTTDGGNSAAITVNPEGQVSF